MFETTILVCLALNVYHEARGEPIIGQIAVAQVVMNRVEHSEFPDNVCDVIHEGGTRGTCQFSWYCDGLSDLPQDQRSWAEATTVAEAVLSGARYLPVGKSLWYHALYVQPNWPYTPTVVVGDHIFYEE